MFSSVVGRGSESNKNSSFITQKKVGSQGHGKVLILVTVVQLVTCVLIEGFRYKT